ncbi:MAG: glycosyltransferase family 2 protein, partial [Oscillospiraceae bacterium]|nr:glycosyltransferase family 2 protein [Oscillospiraceae bacterium]
MTQPLISVIVPCYNVEEYLPRCVESVLNQTYRNLEILLVDDGSPDRCGEICDGYAAVDSRVKVIHKENGGLSDARNVALNVMKGEYVTFVDSDDYVAADYVEYLYKL